MNRKTQTKSERDHLRIVFGLRRKVRVAEYHGDVEIRHKLLKVLLAYQLATYLRY